MMDLQERNISNGKMHYTLRRTAGVEKALSSRDVFFENFTSCFARQHDMWFRMSRFGTRLLSCHLCDDTIASTSQDGWLFVDEHGQRFSWHHLHGSRIDAWLEGCIVVRQVWKFECHNKLLFYATYSGLQQTRGLRTLMVQMWARAQISREIDWHVGFIFHGIDFKFWIQLHWSTSFDRPGLQRQRNETLFDHHWVDPTESDQASDAASKAKCWITLRKISKILSRLEVSWQLFELSGSNGLDRRLLK